MKNALRILQMIPAIIQIVKAVEEVLPEGGQGREKLSLVQDILGEAYEGITDLWPSFEKIIARFVEFAHRTGVFRLKEDETISPDPTGASS